MCGCMMATVLFTACNKNDKDGFFYVIVVEPRGLLSGDNAIYWRNAGMSAYQTELDIDSDKFSKHGSQEECDNEVLNACKRAEMALEGGLGGSGEVIVQNITVKKTVYRRIIQ